MVAMLSPDERRILLTLARQAIEDAVLERPFTPLNLENLPEALRQYGATFVTLTIQGNLRGCIGALEAYQPLAEDVCEHAIGAAMQDYRFPPVGVNELKDIKIEISRLTSPQALDYQTPEELQEQLRPHVDGVILRDGPRRSTFLPHVWEKLPQPADFLNHLCAKMGANPNLWREKPLQVYTYQVEEFHEDE